MEPYSLDRLVEDLKSTPEPLATGFTPLDSITSIPQSAITIVAARPSHGKTTFLLNMLLNMCVKYPKKSFIYFTLLEPGQRIGLKLINILSGEVLDESGNLQALEAYLKDGARSNARVEAGKEMFRKLTESGSLWIVDDCNSVSKITQRIEDIKNRHDVGAAFIDYLQKIDNKKWSLSREADLQRTSHELLEFAKNHSMPIILAAQLRWAENRILRLDNFNEVGDVVQDASLVLGIYNHSIENAQILGEHVDSNVMGLKVTVLKNRDGMVNESVPLRLDLHVMKIGESY